MSSSNPAIYRRVASHESSDDTSSSELAPPRSLSDRCMDKGIALLWFFLAFITHHKCHVSTTLFSKDSHALQKLLQVVALLLGVQVVLATYLCVYLPYFKQLDSSAWPVYCPRVIPTASGLGVLMVVLLIRACWPVWGFLTPLILGIQFMGLLFVSQLIPWPFGG
ncbi:hypothetical protein FisN_20Hh033 [Fistulifera solaris]|uniref:Uncharacterized protein n=1 Tax=Fistulifera solaris TaxID=1519565 RepID=A0A1Z5KCL9_FISSO|nr:hypothetical protein FisN_20Hh033 [Fistulifera solaris]|eukprot:GAX23831.1 hypothetical protein FisN_20Hh033 [Fistulifera solaris]